MRNYDWFKHVCVSKATRRCSPYSMVVVSHDDERLELFLVIEALTLLCMAKMLS